MKRIIAFLLITVFAFGLVSCSDKLPEGVVVAYGDVEVDEGFFYSEVSAYKSSYLYNVAGLDADSPVVWAGDSEEEGVTVGEAIIRLALEESAAMAWAVDWAKKNGIELTDDDYSLIEQDLALLEEQCGGREEYIKFIEEHGFTEEEMKKNAEFSLYYDKAMQSLTSKGGKYEISEEEINEYFEENYVAVKHVYVNNVAELGEDGETYVQISAETLEEKEQKAETIEKALENGDDFDILYSMSDDGMISPYPDGMVITYGDVASIDYEEACFDLEIGEWKRVDIPYYGIYFIKRVESPEALGEQRKAEIPYVMRADIQQEIYDEFEDEFVINKQYIEDFDINAVEVQ